MAIEMAGTNEGVLIGGPVTVTKNQSFLFGMAWVLFRSFPAVDTKVCEYSIGTGINARFTIQYDNLTPGQIFVGGRATDGEGLHFLQAATTPVLGQWTHIAGLLDYANSLGEVYYNGVLQASGVVSAAPFAATQTANTNSTGGAIGSRPNGTQGMDGFIEDFRLYNRRMSQAEIQTIVAAKGKDAINEGLLHRYPLSDGAPPGLLVTTACIANAERIMGTPLGTPTFAPGITVPRSKTMNGTGAAW